MAVVGSALAIYYAWINFHECSMSGKVYVYGGSRPLQQATVGYVPNNPWATNDYASANGVLDFKTLAISGPDGAFSGGCNDARDKDSSFEVFVRPRSALEIAELPCLTPARTFVRLENRGKHDNLVLYARC